MTDPDANPAGSESDNERRRGERRKEEVERARLVDQLVAAEQEERRRISLFLHDGPVQSLSGITLMLDAALHQLASGEPDDAAEVITSALARQRETIKALRDLSFNLEPVVLRDQGFEPAVKALAEHLGISKQIQVDLETKLADELAERAQVVFYQIIREAFHQAIRRGPPTRVAITLQELGDGRVELMVADNALGERRKRNYEVIDERARMLSGEVAVLAADGGGTIVRVVVPPYAVAR